MQPSQSPTDELILQSDNDTEGNDLPPKAQPEKVRLAGHALGKPGPLRVINWQFARTRPDGKPIQGHRRAHPDPGTDALLTSTFSGSNGSGCMPGGR